MVNQGMHGISAYRHEASGFTKLAAAKREGAVKQMSLSKCRRFLAVTDQESASVRVYALS